MTHEWSDAARQALEAHGIPLEGTPQERALEDAIDDLLTTGRTTFTSPDLTVEVSYE